MYINYTLHYPVTPLPPHTHACTRTPTHPPTHTREYRLKQRSNSENERVYNNSLYGNQTEEQQTTRRSTEDSLYTCEAYSVVPVRPADHEYAYIAPPIALRRSTPPGIRRLQCSFVNRLMNTTAKLILSTKVQ